jgi:hypothetical protein
MDLKPKKWKPVTILSVVASFWPVLKGLTETGQSPGGRYIVFGADPDRIGLLGKPPEVQ